MAKYLAHLALNLPIQGQFAAANEGDGPQAGSQRARGLCNSPWATSGGISTLTGARCLHSSAPSGQGALALVAR